MIGGCAFEWGVLALKLYNRKLYDGFFVGKAYGINLQEERSKNLGARNAGSVIGKAAFVWTFLATR